MASSISTALLPLLATAALIQVSHPPPATLLSSGHMQWLEQMAQVRSAQAGVGVVVGVGVMIKMVAVIGSVGLAGLVRGRRSRGDN